MSQALVPPAVEPAPRFPALSRPLRIGQAVIPNRFGMAPMTTNYAELDGSVTAALVDYLGARAKGGFGLIITENFGVHASGRVMPRMVMADSDARIGGMAALADRVHAQGAAIFGQLSHCGRQSRPAFTGGQLLAPSAIACPLNKEVPRALALDEIPTVQGWFVDAALRMERAGFDGIELHAAHGYLLGAFLSRYSNKRDDRYGGELRSRALMLLELVGQIRARSSIPMSVRLSAEEFVDSGNGIEDCLAISGWLRDAGVDAISVSVGVYESFNTMSMVGGEPEARWLHLSRATRQATGMPVLVTGRIHDAARASEALLTGACDIPLFGRSAIADPELPVKSQRGEAGEVIRCIACNVCLGRSSRPETICPVNPRVGREAAFESELAAAPRAAIADQRLLIRGTSLASLTAAWIAASAGLQVVVEVTGAFGGLQRSRSLVPTQANDYGALLRSTSRRAEKAGARFTAERQDAGAYHWTLDEVPEAVSADPSTLQGAERLYLDAASPFVTRQLTITGSQLARDAHPGYRASLLERLREAGFSFGQSASASPPPTPAVEVPASCIADAYEPGRMTAGVYAATELAFNLVRKCRQRATASVAQG